MRRGLFRILGAMLAVLAGTPAWADDVAILDLPFKASAMRGPGSEVALAFATSSLVPVPKAKPASADPKAAPPPQDEPAPVAVVWGDKGGAVLSLDAANAIKVTPVGLEAVEAFVAAETPRGAVPGSRLARSGPLTAYLTGATRSPDGLPNRAAGLTIRERMPLAMTAEPKSVPVAETTVTPGPDRLFADHRPRIAQTREGSVIFAVTTDAAASASLVAIAKDAKGAWAVAAAGPPQVSGSRGASALTPAAVADFLDDGGLQVVAIRSDLDRTTLQLWTYAKGAFALAAEVLDYGVAIDRHADPASVVPGALLPALAVPTRDGKTLAVLAVKDGFRERARFPLPSPPQSGIVVLGTGKSAKAFVGLEDGRVAVVPVGAAGGESR